MNLIKRNLRKLLLAAAFGGMVFQMGGCDLGSAEFQDAFRTGFDIGSELGPLLF